MSRKFTEYKHLNLSEINKEVLAGWNENHLFEQTMKEREGCPSFVFFEGPPSANGMPGIHHVMARTIKDIFCRYKTMKGFHVKRKAGWDTHGLPVELGVEKSLGITKEDIGKKISVDDYNAACRHEVMKYTKEWETLTNSMGYWVDMENPYITYDNRYIETVWWLLAQLYKKGYLYKGYTIQPYSPAAGTGLSTHELNQPGCYRDVKDTTCVAEFEMIDPKDEMKGWGTPFFLAWTTTPWTLPSNTALAVGPNIQYNVVRTYNQYSGNPVTVVCAVDLMGSLFNPKGKDMPLDDYKKGDKVIPYQVVATFKGDELVGMRYKQLFPWVNPGEGAFRVIPGDYVTTEDGTGIVHIAGTFGADDLRVSKQSGVPPLHLIDKDGNIRPMVDMTGRFYVLDDLDPEFVRNNVDIEAYGQWEGRYVKNAFDKDADESTETLDVALCMDLKLKDRVFKIEKHVHSYPHCWRTDKPVLYYPLDSWFIKTTAARDRLVELNRSIQWKPASTGTGRFGKWLENLQDWNLSRSRYWGTPLPIWRTEDGAEETCIDSVETLYNEIEKSVAAGVMESNPYKERGFVPGDYSKDNYEKIDLHRPYVDDIVLVSESGKPMYRETDLIDVWFDSGSMPYAQIHYPFENKEAFDNGELYPADFIAEGVDQTRGWFFTLHAIAGMVFDSVAYKAVISNGLVLDKDGNKMSKRLGNAVNPFETIEKYGSDPVRWYMIANSSPWENLKFDADGVAETSRKLFATLYNTYSFFVLYANVDGFDNTLPQVPVERRPEIDRWILSLLNSLVKEVDSDLNDYEPTKAARAISEFVGDNLSNWYVRLNRKRFWGGEMTEDKISAFQTLYTCLETVARLMAPVAPFFADRLYLDLTAPSGAGASSVHLADFPVADDGMIDKDLEERMHLAQLITSMVLSLRRKVNIKVRQPLSTLMIPVVDEKQRHAVELVKDLVLGEVNVKELKFVGAEDGVLVKRVKPDFKKLGPKFGKAMKQAAEIIKSLSQHDIAELEKNGSLEITVNDSKAVIELADVEVISEDIPGWLVANEGNVTIALDVTVNDELRREGIARDIVNRIQNIRKERDYNITDRIALTFSPDGDSRDAIEDFADYISRQVLAGSLVFAPLGEGEEGVETLSLDDVNVKVKIVLL
ncbi:MAG TPA: isoleucine--tRNA ligase [Butyricimonas virosa]|nr:isoleucine--tRNA ligase [Butyricimonas virosa]